jgi:hypothetical protein
MQLAAVSSKVVPVYDDAAETHCQSTLVARMANYGRFATCPFRHQDGSPPLLDDSLLIRGLMYVVVCCEFVRASCSACLYFTLGCSCRMIVSCDRVAA